MKEFNMKSNPSEVMDYFIKINQQYGSLLSFCTANNLPKAFYYKMNRASSCMVTPTTINTLNESLVYYHPDVQLKELLQGISLEIFKAIKSKYSSIRSFCESNNMMNHYQLIAGFCSGRRKKLPRELVLQIRKITSK